MTKDHRFHQNLELWARLHPKEAVLLPYVEPAGIAIGSTEKGEPNLYFQKGKKKFPLHSPEGAALEAREWFKSLSLRNIQVLYIYGVGLGYFYDAAKSWLKKKSDRTLVFLEDELNVLRHFLETERATDLLNNPQVYLIYLKEGKNKLEALDEIYWNFAMTKAKVTALPYYSQEKAQFFQELTHQIDYTADLKTALIEEYLDFGGSYFINYYRNLLDLPQSYLGDHLFGKFDKIPAIICGAGPSLEKNAHLLHQLQNRGLIFAGGSAINVLNNHGIQPHFGAGIDPNRAQQVRLRTNQAFEVPFFYRNRLNHEAFRTIHGPHLYITGSGGYDVAEYFEEKLDITGESVEEGHNVITFCIELAHKLGCDPIVFLGLDLAFTDRKTYSGGVTFDPSVELKTMELYENFETTGLIRKDIYGNPIYTLWKWIAESEWIGEWAEKHPDIRLINCTEGGLGCPGVPNEILSDAAAKYFNESIDARNRIHGEIQNSRMRNASQEKVEGAMHEMMESLRRCETDFDILIKEAGKVKEKIQQDPKTPPQLLSGKAVLAETELAEEPGYKYILDIFNAVSTRLLTRDLTRIKYGAKPKAEWRKNILRMDVNIKRLEFLRDTAKVNAELIDFAFDERAKEKRQPCRVESMKIPPLRLLKEAKKKGGVDHKSGPWRTYYENRAVKTEMHYLKGVLEGPSVFYGEDGRILAKGEYKGGKLEGECLWYYATGEKYSVQRFLGGVWHGKQEYFYINGSPKTILEYDRGNLVEALLYREDGTLERKIKVK